MYDNDASYVHNTNGYRTTDAGKTAGFFNKHQMMFTGSGMFASASYSSSAFKAFNRPPSECEAMPRHAKEVMDAIGRSLTPPMPPSNIDATASDVTTDICLCDWPA